MAWASSRVTKRVEDMAYCLMGLFDVNMPLIYGEGSKAFYRLQLEIMKSSDDESIFAWTPNACSNEPASYGLLAGSPKDFELSHGIVDCTSIGGDTISYDVSKQYVRLSTSMLDLFPGSSIDGMSNWRLHSQLLGASVTRSGRTRIFCKCSVPWDSIKVAILRCKDETGYICIPLKRLWSGEFERFASSGFKWLRTRSIEGKTRSTILIRALSSNMVLTPSGLLSWLGTPPRLLVASLSIHESGYFIFDTYPPDFITSCGQRPADTEALAGINQALSNGTPLIIFFIHDSSAYKPFTLRFWRPNSWGEQTYYIRVGGNIKEWEEKKVSASPQEDEILVRSYGQIPLSEERSLFIRTRMRGPESRGSDFVNISIGSRLSWQQDTGAEPQLSGYGASTGSSPGSVIQLIGVPPARLDVQYTDRSSDFELEVQ